MQRISVAPAARRRFPSPSRSASPTPSPTQSPTPPNTNSNPGSTWRGLDPASPSGSPTSSTHESAQRLRSPAHPHWQPYPIMRVYRDNQLYLPLLVLTTCAIGSLFPISAPYLRPFLLPSYQLSPADAAAVPMSAISPGIRSDPPPHTSLYGKGSLDAAFVALGVVAWTFARAAVIGGILKPFARACKCPSKLLDRFGEQGWLVVYYSLSWATGMYFAYNSPFWMNTAAFWEQYPHEYLTGPFKAYYLMQLSFWIQQLFVIHIEKPRKDHHQMLTHHVVTIALVVSSYCTNFTRIGCAVLATMDVGDIFLSSAKCFNYVRWRKLCDATFAFFVGVWLYSRHYVYLHILWSVYHELPERLSMVYAPERGHYMCTTAYWFFLTLLSALQVLLVLWLYLIIRVIVKVARGSGAEDNRSDDEEDDDDDDVMNDGDNDDDDDHQRKKSSDGVATTGSESPTDRPARKYRSKK
ncbi:TLC domain-containing protein [Blastocladiella britannica]|nr:TLC domain-containing protein [Blastocladiella britannica]